MQSADYKRRGWPQNKNCKHCVRSNKAWALPGASTIYTFVISVVETLRLILARRLYSSNFLRIAEVKRKRLKKPFLLQTMRFLTELLFLCLLVVATLSNERKQQKRLARIAISKLYFYSHRNKGMSKCLGLNLIKVT